MRGLRIQEAQELSETGSKYGALACTLTGPVRVQAAGGPAGRRRSIRPFIRW